MHGLSSQVKCRHQIETIRQPVDSPSAIDLPSPARSTKGGKNDVQWVKATVSPHNPSVFSFEQVIVEPNLVTYAP